MAIEKISAAEMVKNMRINDVLFRNGIDFVSIPVSSKFAKEALISMAEESFKQLEKDAE